MALHSSYNPGAEAERFVQGLDAQFVPACVVILEGALGHCAPFLRKRFPGAKIGTIRFCADFDQGGGEWDFCLRLDENCLQAKDCAANGDGLQNSDCAADKNRSQDRNCAAPLSERLYAALGEETLFQTLFFEWPASARVWQNETERAWNEIKAALQKAQAVLATREHFGKRWLKNKVSFFERIESAEGAGTAAALQKIQKPVVICAAGPSLEDALPFIKSARESVFVCALSSAAGVLARFNVKPDLLMSTDGGWWAKKHLDVLRKEFLDAPLALATEAACPAALFKQKAILPLCYDDDALSKKLFSELGLPFASARRNGTVSGTALEFFLQEADGPIFFAGLDMQASKTKSHARPNALDSLDAASDFRLRPAETRGARGSMKNASLDFYADWFAAFNASGRKIYRIKGAEPFGRRLGQIQDIDAKEFLNIAESASKRGAAGGESARVCKPKKAEATIVCKPKKARGQEIRRVLEEWSQSDAFANELFPADFIMAKREKDEAKKTERAEFMKKKAARLLQEIFKEGPR